MTATASLRTGFALLLAATIGALSACGGGGGDPQPPAAQTLGPAGGSVVSSDGKVTVSVGANALQAPAAVSIVPGTADAATAADPALVPGMTYTYTAPDIQVPDQVLIEIESAAALNAAAAGRKEAQDLPTGWLPPPTCLVNAINVGQR